MAQFNLKAKDVPKIADILAQGANASTASVGSLAQALSMVGGVAGVLLGLSARFFEVLEECFQRCFAALVRTVGLAVGVLPVPLAHVERSIHRGADVSHCRPP
jgi:hypothetical protein